MLAATLLDNLQIAAVLVGGVVGAAAIVIATRKWLTAGKADAEEISGLRQEMRDRDAKREQEMKDFRRDVFTELRPNGKNTQSSGDTAARTEDKVDLALTQIGLVADKIDLVDGKVERHLGWHQGRDMRTPQ